MHRRVVPCYGGSLARDVARWLLSICMQISVAADVPRTFHKMHPYCTANKAWILFSKKYGPWIIMKEIEASY